MKIKVHKKKGRLILARKRELVQCGRKIVWGFPKNWKTLMGSLTGYHLYFVDRKEVVAQSEKDGKKYLIEEAGNAWRLCPIIANFPQMRVDFVNTVNILMP